MKNLIRKLLGVLLILLTLLSTLTGCVYEENTLYHGGAYYEPGYEWGKSNDILCAKVESYKTFFDIDAVTMDFYYALYSRDYGESLEELRAKHMFIPSEGNTTPHQEVDFAIYISNDMDLIFEKNENKTLVDYKNKVNGIMWKFISFEEAFETDYGYTTTVDENSYFKFKKVNYLHKETITIPEELFNSSSGKIYIHITRLTHNKETDQYYCYYSYYYSYPIKYRVIWDKVYLDLAKSEG